MKTLVAGLFACAVWAHSPQLFAQSSSAPGSKAATGATPAAGPATAPPRVAVPAGDLVESAPDRLDADTGAQEGDDATAPAADKHDVGLSRLEGDLRKVEAEREEYSRFWPWFTVTTGAAITVGSVAVGAGYVFSCDGGCSTPAWIGILVATGTLVGTLGTIWVVNANADVREIDSHRYQLEQEMERIRISANLPNKFDNQVSSSLLSMRFALN